MLGAIGKIRRIGNRIGLQPGPVLLRADVCQHVVKPIPLISKEHTHDRTAVTNQLGAGTWAIDHRSQHADCRELI